MKKTHMQPPLELPVPSELDAHDLVDEEADEVEGLRDRVGFVCCCVGHDENSSSDLRIFVLEGGE